MIKNVRPALILYLTFLELMESIRERLNTFTKRHLDFYYKKALQFTYNPPVVDMVHIFAELDSEEEPYLLKANTELLAGKDEEGKDRIYTTDKDLVLTHTKIAQIKTLHIDKKVFGVEEIRLAHIDDPDKGFMAMMGFALGDPSENDSLPSTPDNIDLDGVLANLPTFENESNAFSNYVTHKLFLSHSEFGYIMGVKNKEVDESQTTPVSTAEWQEVYRILKKAHAKKAIKLRQNNLKQIKEDQGFEVMLKKALGDPEPGDDLPDFPGGINNLDDIVTVLSSTDSHINSQASAISYLNTKLFMQKDAFSAMMAVKNNGDATEDDWKNVYAIVEKAERKKRLWPPDVPRRKEWGSIYTAQDASQNTLARNEAEEQSHPYWRTFGKASDLSESNTALASATFGMALRSPLLLLHEGQREVTLTLAFKNDNLKIGTVLDSIFNPIKNIPSADLSQQLPFAFELSTKEGWIEPKVTKVNCGTIVTDQSPIGFYQATVNGTHVTKTSGKDFSEADIGSFLVRNSGIAYRIVKLIESDQVEVESYGEISNFQPPQWGGTGFQWRGTGLFKYLPEDIYKDALQFVLELNEKADPIEALATEPMSTYQDTQLPILKMALKEVVDEDATTQMGDIYQSLKELKIAQAHLKVSVDGIRQYDISNDEGNLDPKKPFEVLGSEPKVGSSFYFNNPELAIKCLDHLNCNVTWMGTPSDFKGYYANYWKVLKGNKVLEPADYTIKSNSDFKLQWTLYDNQTFLALGESNLFNNNNATRPHSLAVFNIPQQIKQKVPSYSYRNDLNAVHSTGDILEESRYFKCEVSGADFQHNTYPKVLTKQVLSTDGIKSLDISQPYTPKIKSMTLGYTSSVEVDLTAASTEQNMHQLLHLHPFGYTEMSTESTSLLPSYSAEGELYLGLSEHNPPEQLSLLFQMAEGSMDPNVPKPTVSWSYLCDNQWKALDNNILSDSTDGLVNTGIIKIAVPETANITNTLMPNGLHWIRAQVDEHSLGVANTIAIHPQATTATFRDQDNAPSHYAKPLPPQTISEPLQKIPAIDTIQQPYSSSRGKPREQEAAFYQRVSERIRHKSRALTAWDYEHLVLEHFPNIYKVKCLYNQTTKASDRAASVELVVVPDIRGRVPFDPFQPKLPASDLLAIEDYLRTHTSPWVQVKVKSPFYVSVKVRTALRFNEGYDSAYYHNQLQEDLKRYLSPWAYEQSASIPINSSIHANQIVNFLEEQIYVDYIVQIKLFQSDDRITYKDVKVLHEQDEYLAFSTRTDAILVSALEHEIDLITEENAKLEAFIGIGYMSIELDNQVGSDS